MASLASAAMTIALVTGSSRGIGLELCRQLAARGDTVIATCRSATPELRSLPVRVEEGVDVADEASVRELAGRLAVPGVDLLVLNAGISNIDLIFNLDVAAVRRQIEVNALGALIVTAALLDRLHEGAKIALISSRMGSIGGNEAGGMYGYRMSKAAMNAAGRSLALDLKPRGIAVAVLHPGYVATDLNYNSGDISPAESVAGLLARFDELTLATSGMFLDNQGAALPW